MAVREVRQHEQTLGICAGGCILRTLQYDKQAVYTRVKGMVAFLQNPFKHTSTIPGETVADLVMNYVVSRIIALEQVQSVIDELSSVKQLENPAEREEHYVRLYQDLENFITSNKPPFVMDSLTTTRLREIIRHQFELNLLQPEFRLLFLPEIEQILTLFCVSTAPLCQYIVMHVGREALQQIVDRVLVHTELSGIQVTDCLFDVSSITNNIDELWETDLEGILRIMFDALYRAVVGLGGEEYALHLVQASYERLQRLYPYPILQHFLDFVPPGLLPDTRKPTPLATLVEKHLQADEQITGQALHSLPRAAQEEKRALAEEHARLKAAIESMHVGLVMVDNTRRIILMNTAAKNLFTLEHVTLTRDSQHYTIEDVERLLMIGLGIKSEIDACMQERRSITSAEKLYQGKLVRVVFSPVLLTDEVIGGMIVFEQRESSSA